MWLVIAVPVSRADLEVEISRADSRLAMIRPREASEVQRLETEGMQRRMRELLKARTGGAWRTRVLAASITGEGSHRAANLFCSALEEQDLGHSLSPLNEVLSVSEGLAWTTGRDATEIAPVILGDHDLAALLRPPARELPGIQLRSVARFDLTPDASDGLAISLGHILDEAHRRTGDFRIPLRTLNRHSLICGATGSGKSQTTRRILEGLTKEGNTPWLVIEPAKAEYAGMAGRLGVEHQVLVIRPGELEVPPAALNPLEPEPGYPLQSHVDLVRALFSASFEAQEPFPQVLSHALTRCYRAAGWNLVTGEAELGNGLRGSKSEASPVGSCAPYPTLADLQIAARHIVENIGYGPEVAANVRGFVDVRIGSLRQGTAGRFFEGGHPLSIPKIMCLNVVFELDSVTDDQDKAFIMGIILIRIVEYLRVRGATQDSLSHVTVVEEAHRLLKHAERGAPAAAVELFSALLAEIRAYGEGVLIVEQIPSKVSQDVIKNSALKIMHRLPARDDRDAVGATMNLTTENSEAVVSLPAGTAVVAIDGEDRPFLIGVDGGMGREMAGVAQNSPPLERVRSTLCGEACRADPCTLRQMEHARGLATKAPLVVWAETTTAALLAGEGLPELRAHVLQGWPAGDRTSDCVLVSLSERAVAARWSLLRRWLDPDGFRRALMEILGDVAHGRVAGRKHRDWMRAGPYQWSDVHRDLKDGLAAAGDSVDAIGQHDRTDEWRRRGLVLDAPTLAGQLVQLKGHPSASEGTERVLFGDVRSSGLREALVELFGAASKATLTSSLMYCYNISQDDRRVRTLVGAFGEDLEKRDQA
ncbi:MAG: ATP-binding protein [Austwickia sp.]|nr:MAG: ATP-binding protein [Austwickia sp.]